MTTDRAASLTSLDSSVTRLGVALAPRPGDPSEVEGVLNPACTRTRDGKLLLYPRCVAVGNVSRVGMLEATSDDPAATFAPLGFALEPAAPYEKRDVPGGYGCEDPRVTFVPLLDAYVMCYTAFGPSGPRVTIALSADGYVWERLGLVDFSGVGETGRDDKDGVFFPEPVTSPAGVRSLAFYHRPMLRIQAENACAAMPIVLDLRPEERESTRIAYVPVDAVLKDRLALLNVAESALVLAPGASWGRIKNGAGTPPVRIDEGWFSLFHGVDGHFDAGGNCVGMRYSAGIVVHDLERPHIVTYRSPAPVFVPETEDELRGLVNNVVFPTAIDHVPGEPERTFHVYYGMADSRIGRARIDLGPSELGPDLTQPPQGTVQPRQRFGIDGQPN